MTPTDFQAELDRLLAAHRGRTENTRCVECTQCERCSDSTFCRASKGLTRCHYCVECDDTQDSTHCRASRALTRCNHCVECERCTDGAHLLRCVDCSRCTYCFGCVGLDRKDFHILNRPYERREYFALVEKLSAGLTASPTRRAKAP